MNTAQLEQLRQVNIDAMDKTEFMELNQVKVDGAAPAADRLWQYLSQVKNPYAFRVGDVAVKIEFSSSGRSMTDALSNYLLGLKERT